MSRHSVLIIDNDPKTLFTASRLLEENKYSVTLALNGVSGIDFIEGTSFSLILSEFLLKDAPGATILEAARKANPDTVIIFQTTSLGLSFKKKIFKLGADDYLFKPCDNEEMLFRVKKNIEHFEFKQKVRRQTSLLTGCCICKKIRFDDKGSDGGEWMEVEDFLKEEMDILLSSTYCPECAQTVQEDLMVQLDRLKASKVGRLT